MRVKVKICGIRSVIAAEAALSAGADYVGLNFVKTSKRKIEIEKAKEIRALLKGKIALVGVFQNENIETVNRIAEEVGLDFVQLHGDEDNDYIQKMSRPVIKSFTLSDNPENIQTKFLLLDRVVQGEGSMVNIEKAAKLAERLSFFFAGGLTPDNVSDIIKKIQPFGVDVSRGIETDGIEDIEKIRLFVQRAKEFFQ